MASRMLTAQLKRQEGFVSVPRPCPAGHVTIGHGHRLTAWPWSEHEAEYLELPSDWDIRPMTRAEAETVLLQDIFLAENDARALVHGFDSIDEARRDVLVNLTFNMGRAGVLKFGHMLGAFDRGDWDEAAWQLQTRGGKGTANSEWYDEVGLRGPELVAQLRTGKWLETTP